VANLLDRMGIARVNDSDIDHSGARVAVYRQAEESLA